MPKIAVLTSGGDAPGMNAAVRAVVRRAISLGYGICGIRRGFSGLLGDQPFVEMEMGSVADIIHRGGTFLLTARAPDMFEQGCQDQAAARLKDEGIEGLVVIGGDGSFKGAMTLEQRGIKTACVPGTIDNDINGTDQTIGFDTAVNTILSAVNNLRDTATSHERIFLLEVMGRNNGFLALAAGLAAGAESILVPEIDYDIEDICARLLRGIERQKTHSIIVVAEGAGDIYDLNREICARLDTDSRVTVLGHIQRGGSPSAVDRLLGSRMGAMAVDLINEGKSGHFTALRGKDLEAVPLTASFTDPRPFPEDLYRLAMVLAR